MEELSNIYGGFVSLKDVPARIKQWMEQSEIKRQDMERIKNEKEYQKRRIEEKQIRALRGQHRAPGMLGIGEPPANGMSEKLGG